MNNVMDSGDGTRFKDTCKVAAYVCVALPPLPFSSTNTRVAVVMVGMSLPSGKRL